MAVEYASVFEHLVESQQQLIPVIGVVVFILLVFAFGFRAPQEPPAKLFLPEEDERPPVSAKKKKQTKKPQANGAAVNLPNGSASPVSQVSPVDNKKKEVVRKEAAATKGSARPRDKQSAVAKSLAADVADSSADWADDADGEWTRQVSRKDRKNKKAVAGAGNSPPSSPGTGVKVDTKTQKKHQKVKAEEPVKDASPPKKAKDASPAAKVGPPAEPDIILPQEVQAVQAAPKGSVKVGPPAEPDIILPQEVQSVQAAPKGSVKVGAGGDAEASLVVNEMSTPSPAKSRRAKKNEKKQAAAAAVEEPAVQELKQEPLQQKQEQNLPKQEQNQPKQEQSQPKQEQNQEKKQQEQKKKQEPQPLQQEQEPQPKQEQTTQSQTSEQQTPTEQEKEQSPKKPEKKYLDNMTIEEVARQVESQVKSWAEQVDSDLLGQEPTGAEDEEGLTPSQTSGAQKRKEKNKKKQQQQKSKEKPPATEPEVGPAGKHDQPRPGQRDLLQGARRF